MGYFFENFSVFKITDDFPLVFAIHVLANNAFFSVGKVIGKFTCLDPLAIIYFFLQDVFVRFIFNRIKFPYTVSQVIFIGFPFSLKQIITKNSLWFVFDR